MNPELIARDASVKKATRAAFGPTLVELADRGLPIAAVDADLSGSTTTAKFAAAKPAYEQRHFNCGIAEQNMVDVAAGLALAGHIAFTGSDPQHGVLFRPEREDRAHACGHIGGS